MLKVAWSENYAHPLPEGHRFPMAKYELLPEQLLYEGTLVPDNFFEPGMLAQRWILHAHDSVYLGKLQSLSLNKSEIRKTGFPLSKKLVEREIQIAQGSVSAAEYALQHGVAMNIAGGTHHAYADRGEGFCLLNDIAITAHVLLDRHGLNQILVVDLDVHQGNGTAVIFKDEPRVYTFSMHGESNYPLKKEKSDLDIGLPDGTGDGAYLKLLGENLNELMDKLEPEFLIFQSGVDVLKTDKLGRLGLTLQGCKERDKMVLKAAKDNSVPIMCCMGGGYSERLSDILEAHANTYRLAQEMYF
ncbi:histone deacetylase family protein [Pleomorphovibrio marinus]|uniref:histone deacetylase family protein n=1 Tax=Pleomorphovibrio marinus TaxID=2164132 RepID=UPI000E0A3CE0|nr:histone deacetylase [Pleomorphovibrio marinus]